MLVGTSVGSRGSVGGGGDSSEGAAAAVAGGGGTGIISVSFFSMVFCSSGPTSSFCKCRPFSFSWGLGFGDGRVGGRGVASNGRGESDLGE